MVWSSLAEEGYVKSQEEREDKRNQTQKESVRRVIREERGSELERTTDLNLPVLCATWF